MGRITQHRNIAAKTIQVRAFLDTQAPTACFYPAERKITQLPTATLHLRRDIYSILNPPKSPAQKKLVIRPH